MNGNRRPRRKPFTVPRDITIACPPQLGGGGSSTAGEQQLLRKPVLGRDQTQSKLRSATPAAAASARATTSSVSPTPPRARPSAATTSPVRRQRPSTSSPAWYSRRPTAIRVGVARIRSDATAASSRWWREERASLIPTAPQGTTKHRQSRCGKARRYNLLGAQDLA